VDVQFLEQTTAQKTRRLVQALGGQGSVISQATEEHFGMRIVGRDFHRIDGHHAYPWVFEFAGDQARQIALDLIGHPKTSVGQR
jgi:hypothetical protein